jgi:dinuclear metal center YbgI/SA1388 family protein
MKVANLVEAMEAIAPTRFAAAWDNVGLLVGDVAASVSRVLLAVDCTLQVVDEARRERCEAIVAYHPPLFEATKRFCAGAVAYELARSGIAVYSPHTALDVADGGTNDALADALGIADRKPLRVIDSAGPTPSDAWGFGRVGTLPPTRVLTLIDRVKRALGVEQTLVAGPVEREVECAAVCAGSGGDFVARRHFGRSPTVSDGRAEASRRAARGRRGAYRRLHPALGERTDRARWTQASARRPSPSTASDAQSRRSRTVRFPLETPAGRPTRRASPGRMSTSPLPAVYRFGVERTDATDFMAGVTEVLAYGTAVRLEGV